MKFYSRWTVNGAMLHMGGRAGMRRKRVQRHLGRHWWVLAPGKLQWLRDEAHGRWSWGLNLSSLLCQTLMQIPFML